MINNVQIDGLYAAKYFKYRMQFDLAYITQKIDFRRVAAKSFYAKYKKQFDLLIDMFNKNNADPLKYIDFFIRTYGKSERDIKNSLLNATTIDKYADYIKEQIQLDKIFRWFVKSAENISDACIEDGCISTVEYVRKMIEQQKLEYSYVSGAISRYWLAAIPAFKKIFHKMSKVQQTTLVDVYDNFDVYNNSVNEAVMKNMHCKANPIAYTDALIRQKRENM